MNEQTTIVPSGVDELGLEVPFAEGLDAGGLSEAGPPLSEFSETPFAEGDEEESRAWSEGSEETPVIFEGEGFPSGVVLQPASGATGVGEEHWDPHATGLPLLATGPSTHALRLSPNFTVKELVTSGGRAASVARISPQLVQALQAIREQAGKPVKINSGYRSWARNKQVYAGKEPTKSRHCSGQAADIRVAGMTGIQLARLAIDAAGTNLGIGIGADYIHVDVRGRWTVWSYFAPKGGARDRDAIAEVRQHRARVLRSRAPIPLPPRPAPTPPRPSPGPSGTNRLVVQRHPMLRSHRGTHPDLILRWNSISASGDIDVVVHFHGFGYEGQKEALRIDRDKEPISGLDFTDPAAPGTPGRDRPTLGILPRGSYVGGEKKRAYTFPALVSPGALQALIEDSLARLGRETGLTLRRGRLILTGHSGGGAPVSAILAHADPDTDPDEVHVFDGMYQSGASIVRWAERRIAREIAAPGPIPPAMRILYRSDSGTKLRSETVASDLSRSLGASAAARLRPYFRVDWTSVDHGHIPARFGWLLLANAGASLPGVKTFTGASGTSKEAGEEPETVGFWESAPNDREESQQEAISFSEQQFGTDESFASDEADNESLAWLDVEAPGSEAEWSESSIDEGQAFEPEASEAEWSESDSAESLEGEEEGEELDSFEAFDSLEEADQTESEETEETEGLYAGEEWHEMESGEEAGELDRFGEFEDERDAEWESAEFEEELEEETSLAASGLTPAEQKAVEITSTLETGKRGGFFGLAGNFDGQGLSFGLVNWTIGTGSLQPLLRDFAAEHPQRWALAFGPDAARFLLLIARKGKAAEKEQHRFAIEEMNATWIVRGKTKWAIREPWVTYFTRLSEDQEFQKIQIRYVRDLLVRGDYYCRYFKLKSEQSFTFMFDAVSSHGKWWLTKKIGGQERRRILIEQRMKELADRHGEGSVPEGAILLAIADVLGATSAPRWAAKVRERKRWFVTGEHPRARELRGLEPRANVPYSTSARTGPSVLPPQGGRHDRPRRLPSNVKAAIIDRTSLDGMTDRAYDILKGAADAAAQIGLSLEITAAKGGGHKSHSKGTEWDLKGFRSDKTLWTPEERVDVAKGARNAGADRFGLYTFGGGTLHIGYSGPGRPAAVWGHNGLTSGPQSRAFTNKAEKEFLLARRLVPPAPMPPTARGKKLTPAQFVAAYGAMARTSQATNDVPALVTLAQAAIESGWGEKAPRFNFFGIKAKATDPLSTRQLFRTKEVLSHPNVKFPKIFSVTQRSDGRYVYDVCDWFAAFQDAATAFNAHGAFLVRNKRYEKAFRVANDPYAFAREVARAGYASDKTAYEALLPKVMRMIEKVGGP